MVCGLTLRYFYEIHTRKIIIAVNSRHQHCSQFTQNQIQEEKQNKKQKKMAANACRRYDGTIVNKWLYVRTHARDSISMNWLAWIQFCIPFSANRNFAIQSTVADHLMWLLNTCFSTMNVCRDSRHMHCAHTHTHKRAQTHIWSHCDYAQCIHSSNEIILLIFLHRLNDTRNYPYTYGVEYIVGVCVCICWRARALQIPLNVKCFWILLLFIWRTKHKMCTIAENIG